MARWEIIDGPHAANGGQIDGTLYTAIVGNVNDPAQRRIVSILITGQARQLGYTADVEQAVATNGRSTLAQHLDDAQPPDRIRVTADGITVE